MKNKSMYHLLYTAILLALTIVMGRFFLIPVPFTHGNVNLCDAGIFIAAILLGSKEGAFVGGFGGMFLDLISGYSQYMFFSLIVHGLEGLICAWLFKRYQNKFLAVTVGGIVMVLGYFISDSILYTVSVGALGILGNVIQGLVGAVVAVLVVPQLKKRLASI